MCRYWPWSASTMVTVPGQSCWINGPGGSRSIVIPAGKHGVAGYPQTGRAIREF